MSGIDWMAFNVDDYVSNTMHLTARQHGGYILLICAAWKAKGCLPGSDAALMAITRITPKEWREDGPVLKAFLTRRGDSWVHERVEFEWKDAQTLIEAKRKAGKEGARKRWHGRGNGSAMADPSQTKRQTDAPLPEPIPTPDVSAASSVSDSAREDDGDWEPESAEVIVPRFQPAVGRAAAIGPDWLPSEETQRSLARARPDLTPARIQQRTAEFRAWCAETNKQTHNPDATWFNFLVKTHVERDDRPTAAAGQRSPELAGIAAARARRSVLAGH